jgi:hypothetical protein
MVGLRFHQRRSGHRVALPADRHPAQPDGLPGRRDQLTTRTCRHCRPPTTSRPTPAEAIAKAVNAGVDMAMYVVSPDQWQTATLRPCTHMISKARIDEAVRRILTLKFQLGLFDQPVRQRPEHAVRRRQRRQRSGHRWATRTLQARRNRSPCCATRTTRCRSPRPPRSSSPARAPTR